MDKRETIAKYYQCFRERNQEGLRAILTTSFRHVSNYATYTDRDVMIEAIWPAVGKSWARDLRIFGDGDEYMVRYEIEAPERPSVSMAERIRFEGDRIAEVEVFTGRQVGT